MRARIPLDKHASDSAMLPSILRLDVPSMRAIRAHVLAGDDLAAQRDGELLWLKAAGIDTIPASSGRVRLSFVYRAADETLTLTLGLMRPEIAEAVVAACGRMSMAHIDRCWRPTVARTGRIPEAGTTAKTALVRLEGPLIAAARRAVHPSYVLDRLMMRQRAIVRTEIEGFLTDATSPPLRHTA